MDPRRTVHPVHKKKARQKGGLKSIAEVVLMKKFTKNEGDYSVIFHWLN